MISTTVILYMALFSYAGVKGTEYLNKYHTSEPAIERITDEEIKDLKLEDPMSTKEMMEMLDELDRSS